MFASVRGTRIYFDVEGMGLVPDGPTMRERPVAMVIHGGPGGDHSGFKPGFTSLAARMQLVYFDHRGQGRSDAADPATYTLDVVNNLKGAIDNIEARHIVWWDGGDGTCRALP